MKLGIMQPYFFPYLGYWQLINCVDKYVLYDDVTYIKGGWINRNNFLINKEKKLFTISLLNAGSFALIKDIEIKDDFVKFLKMLKINYSKAPYYNKTISLITKIVSFEDKKLGNFLFNAHKVICDYLCIKTELILSSSIGKDNELKNKEKVIHICSLLKANEYINAIGGQELYNKNEFESAGIKLSFLQSNLSPYQQFKNEFIPGLSIIDVLMFNSKEEVIIMLNDYILL